MRDRDSQLIFENYNKRVLLMEQAAALALPAVEGLGAAMSWIAGTAVGAVVVDRAMKALEQIPEFKKQQIESKIGEINKITALNPQEIRSHYEIINTIQKNGNNTLSELAENFKQPINIFRTAQDEGNVTIDTYSAVLASSIEAYKNLLNAQDLIDREIDQVISKSDLAQVEIERIKARRAKDKLEHKERLAELENEKLKLEAEIRKSGGGGGKNDKDPKKGGKWSIIGGIGGGINLIGLALKVLGENYKTLKGLFWTTVILVPGFGIYIIKLLFGSGEQYGKAAKEFAGEFKKTTEDAVKSPSVPQPKTKPTPRPLPDLPTTSGSPSRFKNPVPSATPDPYSF